MDDSPIIGANITIKGDKNTGTISDIDGNFSLSIPDNKTILVVTYIGYKTREVPVEDLGNIKIVLEGDDHTLNEVVVVGSGTQKKVSVTGAITSIKGASLKLPSSTLSNSFAGKLAGVIAKTNSGEPGSGAEFYIRGIGTFGGRATPLILLDDVEISSGDLNYVPAENIESFSILKDASATAIYGSRGANGVMIVTTKGGEYNSKTSINVTAENSFNYLDKFPEFVDGATYMDMYNKASLARNSSATPKYSATDMERTASGVNPYLYPDVNWQDVLFKNMSMRQRKQRSPRHIKRPRNLLASRELRRSLHDMVKALVASRLWLQQIRQISKRNLQAIMRHGRLLQEPLKQTARQSRSAPSASVPRLQTTNS